MRATTVTGKQGGDPGEPAVEGKSNIQESPISIRALPKYLPDP